jgi:hypothetical protein
VEDRRQIAARTAELRLEDLQHEPRRHAGIEGVAALLEHRHADRGRDPMRRGDDAEGSFDLGAGGEHEGLRFAAAPQD